MTIQKAFVSAQDVATRAGVSRSAVSRTFTPGKSVSAETRAKVLAAADALGYHVNHLARGLMRNESGIVCLIVSDLGTPYRSNLVKALTQQLQDAGKIAMLINTDRSDESVGLALRQAIRYRADASIVVSGMPDKSIVKLCLRNGLRLVLINRDDEHDGTLRINLDDAKAAENAVTAFARAGCKQLALINSTAGTPSLMAREAGFIASAAARDLPVTVEHHGHTSYASGRLMAQRLLTRPTRPDGVFCVTDLLACGFMDTARREFHLDIPKDLCVIGFDDIEQASWMSYNITTFAQPIDDIAANAVAWLRGDAEQTERISLRLHADMVWRGSVRGG